jgi:DNA polymerase (family 10)
MASLKNDRGIPLELILGIGPVLARKYARRGIKTRTQLMKAAVNGNVSLSKLTLLDLKYNVVRQIKRSVVKKCVEPFLPPNAMLVGSYAQGKPIMGDIDVLVVTPQPSAADAFPVPPPFGNDLIIYRTSGADASEQRVTSGIWKIPHGCKGSPYVIVDVFYATDEEKPFAMLHYQGPVSFNMRVRAVAKKLGYKLNQYGLTPVGANVGAPPKLASERDVLDFLGITWKEPHER